MTIQMPVTFVNMKPEIGPDKIKNAIKGFIEWTSEGGLTDEINPYLRQNYGVEIYCTGSSQNSLEFTVNVSISAKPK